MHWPDFLWLLQDVPGQTWEPSSHLLGEGKPSLLVFTVRPLTDLLRQPLSVLHHLPAHLCLVLILEVLVPLSIRPVL